MRYVASAVPYKYTPYDDSSQGVFQMVDPICEESDLLPQHPLLDIRFIERGGDQDEDQRRRERLNAVLRHFP